MRGRRLNRYAAETLFRTSVSLPIDLHLATKQAARAKGMTPSEYLVELLRSDTQIRVIETDLKAQN